MSTKVAKTAYQITNNDLYKQHIRKTVPFDTNLKSLFVLTYPSTRVLQLALPQPTDRIHEIAELNSDAILPAELASFAVERANSNVGGNVLSLDVITRLQGRLDIYQENTAITCVFFASKSNGLFSGGLFNGKSRY